MLSRASLSDVLRVARKASRSVHLSCALGLQRDALPGRKITPFRIGIPLGSMPHHRFGGLIRRFRMMLGCCGHLSGLCNRFLDGPDHIESLLRNIVILTFADFPEPSDGVFHLHVFSCNAGEGFRDVERL